MANYLRFPNVFNCFFGEQRIISSGSWSGSYSTTTKCISCSCPRCARSCLLIQPTRTKFKIRYTPKYYFNILFIFEYFHRQVQEPPMFGRQQRNAKASPDKVTIIFADIRSAWTSAFPYSASLDHRANTPKIIARFCAFIRMYEGSALVLCILYFIIIHTTVILYCPFFIIWMYVSSTLEERL